MAPALLGEVYQNVTESIEYAETAMTKARSSVEKARTSKENRNKVVSKASEVVNALLEPASQVANLLDGIGAFFPPCKVASNTLSALVKLEIDRRDNDVRIALLFLDFATALANLGTLSPGFQDVTTLTRPLEILLKRFTGLMEEFGRFCESYYEARALKSKLKHLLYSKSNRDSLQSLAERLVGLKNDLTSLLSQQAVLVLRAQTDTLSRIESRLAKNHQFYASVSDESEDSAMVFVSRHGGEDIVRTDERLLKQLATIVGEDLTPIILRAIKEGTGEAFKQSQASFMLKFKFALEQRIEESQETILNELKSGPYELIHNTDVKEIWKNTAAKEASVKRRQFIDGMNYFFNLQFKRYKAEHHRAEREDSWTRDIVSKVHFHPAIGDAIDDDASGYISVEEVNEFMRRKPENWTVPQWIAYWAYGWDADNRLYGERIVKTYTQLGKLKDAGGPNAELVGYYLSETEERISVYANSLYKMRELDPSAEMKMDRLRDQLRDRSEKEIKGRLKSVNHKIDYSVLAAVTGSERIEATFLPLASLLISRHSWLMSKPDVSSEVVEEATSSIFVLVEAMRGRIEDLKMIWRRQRMDVDTQIRYYANGLLEDYYRKYRKEEFDTDLEGFGEESEWDSEDEWASEDDAGDDQVAENEDTSGAAERDLYPPASPSHGQGHGQPYPDNTTSRGVSGYQTRDVADENDEDEEEEAVDEPEEESEQEQDPDPELYDEEGYPVHAGQVEDDEEEQGYNAHDEEYGEYGASGPAEEYEDEDEGGYGYRAE